MQFPSNRSIFDVTGLLNGVSRCKMPFRAHGTTSKLLFSRNCFDFWSDGTDPRAGAAARACGHVFFFIFSETPISKHLDAEPHSPTQNFFFDARFYLFLVMPPKESPRTHNENRSYVCLICFTKPLKPELRKNLFIINGVILERVQKYFLENYDPGDEKLPNVTRCAIQITTNYFRLLWGLWCSVLRFYKFYNQSWSNESYATYYRSSEAVLWPQKRPILILVK